MYKIFVFITDHSVHCMCEFSITVALQMLLLSLGSFCLVKLDRWSRMSGRNVVCV